MPRNPDRGSKRRARRAKLTIGMLVGGTCVVAACVAGRYYLDNRSASADPGIGSLFSWTGAKGSSHAPQQPTGRAGEPGLRTGSAPAAGSSQMKIVATVNGEDITRSQLGDDCLRQYGEEMLETLVNQRLIQQECQRRNVSVTRAEVNAEIERAAAQLGFSVEHWMKLQQDREINPKQHAELMWQLLTMRKLAGARLDVTPQELRECFEREYGEAVKARMIVCDDRKTAEEVRAVAIADPEQFGKLAREHSVDPSAGLDGLIGPIRKHTGFQELDQAAFGLKDGEISQVIPVVRQYVILKREGTRPAVKVAIEQVKTRMIEAIRDEKSKQVAHEILRELQQQARVENVLNDPAKRRQMPGVAALVNGRRITLRELAEACIEWHGKEVLETTIDRRLLEQACKRQKIAIGPKDLEQELALAASQLLPLKPDGSPDVETWVAMRTKELGISAEAYRRDMVWQRVALTRLVGDQVQVTEEDLRKGFEADFGPQVRCLAIVLDDLRRAQRVWDMANGNPTREYFGDLAEQYSIEPGSKALRGEVRPIRKHGGQPKLEEAAFQLRAGELSRIIQVGRNRYVILLCEGRTEPIEVDFAEARDEIYVDLHEKKLRLAMLDYFRQLQERATIDNHLAGTVRSPGKSARPQPGPLSPAVRQTSFRPR